MDDRTFPCRCGHVEIRHEDNPDSYFFRFCNARDEWGHVCRCTRYTADNLLYLERQVPKND